MDKKTLLSDIRSECGSMVTIAAFIKYMKCSKTTAYTILRDLDYVSTGRKKYYLASDIADALLARR